jgi:hypothetical protein
MELTLVLLVVVLLTTLMHSETIELKTPKLKKFTLPSVQYWIWDMLIYANESIKTTSFYNLPVFLQS